MNDGKADIEWRSVWARRGLGIAISTNPIFVYQSALVLFGRGECWAAEAAFREVLARAPRHIASLTWLANLLANRGRHDEAASFTVRRLEAEARLEAAAPGDDPCGSPP